MSVFIVMGRKVVHAKASECPAWVCSVYATEKEAEEEVVKLRQENEHHTYERMGFWVEERTVEGLDEVEGGE